jgi:hypothetical protein
MPSFSTISFSYSLAAELDLIDFRTELQLSDVQQDIGVRLHDPQNLRIVATRRTERSSC